MSKKIDVGIDISTSCVGICFLDSIDESLEDLFSIRLTSSAFKDIWDKAVEVENVLKKKLKDYEVQNIYIEASHMRFTPGFSSAKTLFSLATFNGITSFITYKLTGVKPTMINVRSARNRAGIKIDYKDKSRTTKEKVFEEIFKLNPKFPWKKHLAKGGKSKGQMVLSKDNYDMADAWLICYGGKKI